MEQFSVVSMEKVWEFDWPSISLDPYGSYKELLVDRRVSKELHRQPKLCDIFISHLGRYACNAPSYGNKVFNPFKVDIKAICSITDAFCKAAQDADLFLGGWHIYDDGSGVYKISCTAYYGYDTVISRCEDEFGYLLYNPKTSEICDPSQSFYADGKLLSSLLSNIPAVLKSLNHLKIPVDLLEVCCTGEYNKSFGRTSLSYNPKMPVASGVSVISERNGFRKFQLPEGKAALLVVVK